MIVTVALLLETPFQLVYADYYKVLTIMASSAELFMFPWLVCETLFGQLMSFTVSYAFLVTSFHMHFD